MQVSSAHLKKQQLFGWNCWDCCCSNLDFIQEMVRTQIISISTRKSGSWRRTGLMDNILCGHFVDSNTVIELAHLDRWLWLFAWTNNKWKLHPGLKAFESQPCCLAVQTIHRCLQCYNIKATTKTYSSSFLYSTYDAREIRCFCTLERSPLNSK